MAHLPDDDLPSTFDVVVVGTGKRRAISVSLCVSVPTYLCFFAFVSVSESFLNLMPFFFYRSHTVNISCCCLSSW